MRVDPSELLQGDDAARLHKTDGLGKKIVETSSSARYITHVHEVERTGRQAGPVGVAQPELDIARRVLACVLKKRSVHVEPHYLAGRADTLA